VPCLEPAFCSHLNPMTKSDRHWWCNPHRIAGYAVAVGSVAAALTGSRWLEIYAVTAPVSLLLCAVMFSAWFGGFGPGSLATALSVLAFKFYYVPPLHTFVADAKEIPRIFVFALSALFAGLLSAAQRSATESVRRARDDLKGSVQALERSNEACVPRTSSAFGLRRRCATRRRISRASHG
jgi:K+-sensing histidine kinase KdpD